MGYINLKTGRYESMAEQMLEDDKKKAASGAPKKENTSRIVFKSLSTIIFFVCILLTPLIAFTSIIGADHNWQGTWNKLFNIDMALILSITLGWSVDYKLFFIGYTVLACVCMMGLGG